MLYISKEEKSEYKFSLVKTVFILFKVDEGPKKFIITKIITSFLLCFSIIFIGLFTSHVVDSLERIRYFTDINTIYDLKNYKILLPDLYDKVNFGAFFSKKETYPYYLNNELIEKLF